MCGNRNLVLTGLRRFMSTLGDPTEVWIIFHNIFSSHLSTALLPEVHLCLVVAFVEGINMLWVNTGPEFNAIQQEG